MVTDKIRSNFELENIGLKFKYEIIMNCQC